MRRSHHCQHVGCDARVTMSTDAATHARTRWWCSRHVADVPHATGRAGVVRYDKDDRAASRRRMGAE